MGVAADSALDVLQDLTAVIVLGVIASRFARRFEIPDVVPLLLAGMIGGPGLHLVRGSPDSVTGQLVLTVGVAFLLFEGGLGLSIRALRPTWPTIVLLATVGVGISAAVTGLAASLVWGLPALSALLIGAVAAPTDPAALIPLFRQVTVREKCVRTLVAESALNDATGALLALGLAAAIAHGGAPSLWDMARGIAWESAIGLAVGAAIGWLLAFLLARERYAPLAPQLVLLGAISAYTVTARLGGSGFLGAFVAGLLVEELDHVPARHFVDNLSTLFRTMIFVNLGSTFDLGAIRAHAGSALAVVAVMVVAARPLTVFACAAVDRRARWTRNELLFLCWARPIGVMAAALLGLLSTLDLPYRGELYSATFLAILVTLIGQAGTAGPVARRLGVLASQAALG